MPKPRPTDTMVADAVYHLFIGPRKFDPITGKRRGPYGHLWRRVTIVEVRELGPRVRFVGCHPPTGATIPWSAWRAVWVPRINHIDKPKGTRR
jgi:hypothetical protein